MIAIVNRANQDLAKKSARDAGKPRAVKLPTLDEIQKRAYRVHHDRGGIYGGYTLDEWLEAERELNNELQRNRRQNELVH
jgi:hypothetical protein